MTGGQVFRLVEWPVVREVAPGILALVFLLCFTSFAVVLTLGGGPPNATLEVAIYQALRFDFDLPRVLGFAVLQVGLCALLVALAQRLAKPVATELSLARTARRYDTESRIGRVGDAAAIALGAGVMLLPLGAVVVAGLTGPIGEVLGGAALWQATGRSLAVGLSSGVLALVLGWGLIVSARYARVRLWRRDVAETFDLLGTVVLVVPPFVLGAGLFVLLRGHLDVFDWALALVVPINALMGLPFVLRILGPAATRVAADHWRLAASLGMGPLDRFRLIDWPLLRRPAALALAVAVALALGDLGVIALFGSQETRTVPLLLYQLMGSYRTGEAAVVALWLIGLTLAMFLAIERGIGGRGDD
jgi:thiamine transport system permease protein